MLILSLSSVPRVFWLRKRKLPSLILDLDYLDTLHILQKCGVFSFSYAIWMATYNHGCLEFGSSSFILYHKAYRLRYLPRKEEISL